MKEDFAHIWLASLSFQLATAATTVQVIAAMQPTRGDIVLASFVGAFIAAAMTIKPALTSDDRKLVSKMSLMAALTFAVGFAFSFAFAIPLYTAVQEKLAEQVGFSVDQQIFAGVLAFFGEKIMSVVWSGDFAKYLPMIKGQKTDGK